MAFDSSQWNPHQSSGVIPKSPNRRAHRGAALSLVRLSTKRRKQLADLLDQQLWCWGQDVKAPDGNLLVAYGFDRHAPPSHLKTASQYVIKRHATSVTLRGFGVVIAEENSPALFLRRYSFEPMFFEQSPKADDLWQSEVLPEIRRPQLASEWRTAGRVVRLFLQLVSDYERWIQLRQGLAYRNACLQRAPKPFAADAQALSTAWAKWSSLLGADPKVRLRNSLASFLHRSSSHTREPIVA